MILKLLTIILPLSLFADLPNWYFTESSSKVPICLKLNSSISQLRIIAIAKAQSQLLRQIKTQVESELVIIHNSNSTTGKTSSEINEKISQKAQGIIQGKKVLKSGIFYFDGVKNYCILYGK